jgi:beclin
MDPTFRCQQCKEPLQLDASLIDLAPSAYDMITASLPPSPSGHSKYTSDAEKLAHLPTPSSVKSAWQQGSSSKNNSSLSPRAQGKQAQRSLPLPNESFVLLQDSVIRNIPSPVPSSPARNKRISVIKPSRSPSAKAATLPTPAPQPAEPDHPNPSPLSHHLRSTLKLFNLLSTRTEIDHPLCAECTQILLTSLQRQLDETKKERDGYIAFEKEVRKERERDGQGMSKQEAERKIEKLKGEEAKAVSELKEAEREAVELNNELKALEEEEKELEEEEAE